MLAVLSNNAPPTAGDIVDRRGFWRLYAALGPYRLRERLRMLDRGFAADELDVPFCAGRTPLGLAAADGCRRTVERLLALGATPDAIDMAGRAPLHVAISRGHGDIARRLLDAGADVNVRDGNELTPLMYALHSAEFAVAEDLLARGARADDVDADGRAVAQYAAFKKVDVELNKTLKTLLARKQQRARASSAVSTVSEFHRWRYLEDLAHSSLFSPLLFLGLFVIFGDFFVAWSWLGSLLFGESWRKFGEQSFGWLEVGLVSPTMPPVASYAAVFTAIVLVIHLRHLKVPRGVAVDRPGPMRFDSLEVKRILHYGSLKLLRLDTLKPSAAGRRAARWRIGADVALALAAVVVFAASCALAPLGSAAFFEVKTVGKAFAAPFWHMALACLCLSLVAAALLHVCLRLAAQCARHELQELQTGRNRAARRFLSGSTGARPRCEIFGLYLRSFEYDPNLQLGRQPFEATLAYSIGRSLELVALGRPDTLGSARLATSDAAWQEDFERLADAAVVIFLVPGASPGTLFEIDALQGKGLLGKTVFLMPPEARVGTTSMAELWGRMLAHPRLTRFEFPEYQAMGAVFTLNNRGRIRSWGPIGVKALPIITLSGVELTSGEPIELEGPLAEDIDGDVGGTDLAANGSSGDAGEGGGGEGGGGE